MLRLQKEFQGRSYDLLISSMSTPALDRCSAQLHQGLFADFMLRKLMTKKFRDLKKLKSSGAGNSSLFFQVRHIHMKLECATSQFKINNQFSDIEEIDAFFGI
ncbi:hypothetical protein [Paenibacillus elgii]|uniref:hypothetical protein n=1 Tax=Paenibacillus elgii TaxID=189691 RepID=UPI001ED9226B|nr:hypothetical protein [Paenibacillus elgii]